MKKIGSKGLRIAIIAVVLIAIAIAALDGFITDYLWFSELGYTSVFLTELLTKIKLGLPVFAVVALVSFVLLLAIKSSFYKKNKLHLENEESKKRVKIVTIVLALVFSCLLTIPLISNLWFEILKFNNATSFNVADPLFGKDVSFYIFRLEFLSSLAAYATKIILGLIVMITIYFGLLLTFAKTEPKPIEPEIFESEEEAREFSEAKEAAEKFDLNEIFSNFFNGKKRSGDFTEEKQKAKSKLSALIDIAAREICILIFLFFVAIASTVYLKQFDMLYSGTGVAYGAGYTDVNITLNVYRIVMICSVCAAVCVPLAIKLKKWKLGVIFPALIIAVSVLGVGAEALVQNLIVSPDELSKETKYLENNIEYTRLAYNLSDIDVKDFSADGEIGKLDVYENMETFSNIRINDFDPAQQFYNQTQSIRSYYTFNDVDVDRYLVNGEYTQVFLSAREIDSSKIDDSWIIRHLKYTHGYGLTLSRVDKITGSGQPEMMIESIPPVSEIEEISIDRPEIYYGESTRNYVITNTDETEFDYPAGETNVYCTYEGNGGIKLNFLNRILFAIREHNLKLLISGNINSDSKILINRDITTRIEKIAPFLTINDDPYVVTVDGKIYWIVDAYTASAYYPYSEPYSNRSDCNYIRNSVKIIIDAYNGTTDFYICDEEDPIAATLAKIYPGLFKSLDAMPDALRSHLQYPNMLFEIQASVFAKYHMTNVEVFYQSEDLWAVANENYGQTTVKMSPNYFIMKLPGEENAEFVSAIPYTPNSKSNMTGVLMARQDGAKYGQLILYRMPKDRTIYGPAQIEAQINQDAEISKEFSLWNNSGSNYLRGNLYVIPVNNALLYVEPIYLEASSTSLPEVKRVVMFYKDKVAYKSTLAECLDALFGDGAGDPLLTPYPIITGKEMAEKLKAEGDKPTDVPTKPDDPVIDTPTTGELSKEELKTLMQQLTDVINKINSLLN